MPLQKSVTKPKNSWQFDALGTEWRIDSTDEISYDIKRDIASRIEAFDRIYSRFRNDSLIYAISHKVGVYQFPEQDVALFELYDTLFGLSGGRVTPLIGDTLVGAGYDRSYSLEPEKAIVPVPDFTEVVSREGATMTISRPVTIDIGAAGKGYLVDRVVELMLAGGHDNFTVDASGDIRVVGQQEASIALENPFATDEAVGIISVKNKAMCASATNRRAWGTWHHIIDPLTSRPVEGVVATWVIADTAMVADGLATALFFVSPEKLNTAYTYEYARIFADGSIEYSDYFSKGIFS